MNIVREVCRKHCVTRANVLSAQLRYRCRPALKAAALEAAWRLRQERRLSYARVAELLNRSEGTIRYWLDEAYRTRKVGKMRARHRQKIGGGYKTDDARRRAESRMRNKDLGKGDKTWFAPDSAFCPPGLSP